MKFRTRYCAASFAICTLIISLPVLAADKKEGHFDKGTDADLEEKVNYKEKTPGELRKERKDKLEKEQKKQAASIAYHIKQLKTAKDEVDRSTSAEYLGALNAYVAIPDMIDRLRPAVHEKDSVMRACNGALIKLTQQNLHVEDWEKWDKWWVGNKLKFMKEVKEDVPETDKITAESENMLGRELMKRNECHSAFNHFLVALEKNPKIPDYHNNAGLALLEMGRPMDAIIYFEETIDINKDLPQPYLNIGRVYSRMGKSIEAQKWFDLAKEKDKNGVLFDVFWMKGKEFLKRGEYKLAYEYLDQARTKAEKQRIRDPRLYNDIAICHYGLDQYHSAWKELCNIRFLNFVPNPDFEAKVRKALVDMGSDPDEEDKLVRDNFEKIAKEESGDDADPSAKKEKTASILDTVSAPK